MTATLTETIIGPYLRIQPRNEYGTFTPKNEGCLAPGCTREHHGHGYCAMHLQRLQANGTLELSPREKAPKQMCEVEGCNEEQRCSGYCKKHYTKFLRHGTPEPECCIPGCEEPHAAKGYCRPHYNKMLGELKRELKALGPAGFVPIEQRCSIEGCMHKQHSRTYCQAHYRRWYEYGDPEGTPETRENPEELPDHLKHYLERRRGRIARQEKARHLRN